MKKIFFLLICLGLFTFLFSCEKEKPDNNPGDRHFQIDSIKQDSVLFAHSDTILGTVRVYYTIFNDVDEVLNCYRYTINAMNADSVLFQISESHYNTVPGKSKRQDSTKIGIGNSKYIDVHIDNTLFQ